MDQDQTHAILQIVVARPLFHCSPLRERGRTLTRGLREGQIGYPQLFIPIIPIPPRLPRSRTKHNEPYNPYKSGVIRLSADLVSLDAREAPQRRGLFCPSGVAENAQKGGFLRLV